MVDRRGEEKLRRKKRQESGYFRIEIEGNIEMRHLYLYF